MENYLKSYIHDCDVSGCKYYKKYKCLAEYQETDNRIRGHNLCLSFPNCYYKQLKLLEKRCAELNIDNECLKTRLFIKTGELLAAEKILSKIEKENER